MDYIGKLNLTSAEIALLNIELGYCRKNNKEFVQTDNGVYLQDINPNK